MSDVDFLPDEPGDESESPMVEFKLTQLDKSNVNSVKELLYTYSWKRDQDTQTLVKTIDKVNYPDIVPAFSYATSHLNMMINIPVWMGEVILEDWEGTYYDKLEMYYKAKNDKTALSILQFLDNWIRRNIAAAVDGSQQDYNIKMQGNYKVHELKRNEQ